MRIFKIGLILILVTTLSSCTLRTYENGTSTIHDISQIEIVLEEMMDQTNKSYDTMVPYNFNNLNLKYSNGIFNIFSISYLTERKFKDEMYYYTTHSCYDVQGLLECTSENMHSSEEVPEEITLGEVLSFYQRVNIQDMMKELTTNYDMLPNSENVIMCRIVKYNEDVESLPEDRVVIQYYNNQFHYDTEYDTDELVLEVQVFFVNDEEGESYHFYYIDE